MLSPDEAGRVSCSCTLCGVSNSVPWNYYKEYRGEFECFRCKKNSAMPLEPIQGEKYLFGWSAALWPKPVSSAGNKIVGGMLYLTNYRLLFKPNKWEGLAKVFSSVVLLAAQQYSSAFELASDGYDVHKSDGFSIPITMIDSINVTEEKFLLGMAYAEWLNMTLVGPPHRAYFTVYNHIPARSNLSLKSDKSTYSTTQFLEWYGYALQNLSR